MSVTGVENCAVVDEQEVVGVVLKEDVLAAIQTLKTQGQPAGPLSVREVMRSPVVVVPSDARLTDVLDLVVGRKAVAAAVTEEEAVEEVSSLKLKRIVTVNDLLRHLARGSAGETPTIGELTAHTVQVS